MMAAWCTTAHLWRLLRRNSCHWWVQQNSSGWWQHCCQRIDRFHTAVFRPFKIRLRFVHRLWGSAFFVLRFEVDSCRHPWLSHGCVLWSEAADFFRVFYRMELQNETEGVGCDDVTMWQSLHSLGKDCTSHSLPIDWKFGTFWIPFATKKKLNVCCDWW